MTRRAAAKLNKRARRMCRAYPSDRLAAKIRNAAWLVRHYGRGRRSAIHRLQRAQAIQRLGLIVRYAFRVSEDFEQLLIAIVEGLKPTDYEPPF